MKSDVTKIVYLDTSSPAVEIEGPAVVMLPQECSWYEPKPEEIIISTEAES